MERKPNDLRISKTTLNDSSPSGITRVKTSGQSKQVDIGLELLANPEKKSMKSVDTSSQGRSVINLETSSVEHRPSSRDELDLMSDIDNARSQDDRRPSSSYKVEPRRDLSGGLMDRLGINRESRISDDDVDRIIRESDDRRENIDDDDHDLMKMLDKNDIINPDDIGSEEINGLTDEQLEDYMNKIENGENRSHDHNDKPNLVSENGSQINFAPREPEREAPRFFDNNMMPTRRSPEEERKEKEELLFKFEKWRRLGINTPKRFNMSSDLDEMKYEYNRIKQQRELESSVNFQRKAMMAFVTGVEYLNNKFDPFDIRLDGWSEAVYENQDEYTEIFEELHEKYKEKAKMAPELKLLLTLGGSAFMFHMSQSLFKSAGPGVEDLMKQNPDLARQFAQAAINNMTPQNQPMANFMAGFMPGGQQPQRPPMMPNPTMTMPPASMNTMGNPMIPPPNQAMFMPKPEQRPMEPRPNPQSNPQIPRGMVPNGVMGMASEQGKKIEPPIVPFDLGETKPMSIPAYSEPARREEVKMINTSPRLNTTTVLKPNKPERKIAPPSGVDDILNELKSNTDDLSDIISRTSRKSGDESMRRRPMKPKRVVNIA
jgi:hypothetical protein